MVRPIYMIALQADEEVPGEFTCNIFSHAGYTYDCEAPSMEVLLDGVKSVIMMIEEAVREGTDLPDDGWVNTDPSMDDGENT